MTDYCEILEASAEATSDCPSIEGVTVLVAGAVSAAEVNIGRTHALMTGAGESTSQVTIDAYAILNGAAAGTSTLSHTLVVTGLVFDAANAKGSAIVGLTEVLEAVAQASAEIAAADVPVMLVSGAQATGSIVANTIGIYEADASASAKSSVTLGMAELANSAAVSASMVVLLRRVNELVVNNADGVSTAYPSNVPQDFLLISTASGSGLALVQGDHNLLIEADASANAGVWYTDPGRKAWVMNTETTAASWYDNFDFESITQTPDGVLAVGPDGLYTLDADTDAGINIQAEVVSGLQDFGAPQTKRMDYMYFGYTSGGQISVTPEVYESGHAPVTYFLEQRDASAPRNSRVEPGKGLFGRYWRVTIRNVAGADFEVHDTTVDIAVSNRKV